MRIALCFAIVAVLGMVVTGCYTSPAGPVVAPLILDQSGPVAVGDLSVGTSKEGRATATGIVIFAMGDASIKAAMADGEITRIHHVDSKVKNYLGIYSTYTTIVYGE